MQAFFRPRETYVPILRLCLLLLFGLGILSSGAARAADSAERDALGRGLVSHRAFYGLSVARLDPRNYRQGVAGGLSLEFVNACDGYVLNQRFVIETSTEDGPVLNDMVLNSWESHDGRQFRFKLKDEVNGDLEQQLDGEARLAGGDGGGRISFTLPPDTELILPDGTMFPTEHTIRLLALARAGKNWLQTPVYDGSSADSYVEIGSFISGELPPEAGERNVLKPMKGQRSWRIRLAYFTSGKTQDTPDYEIGYRLYENGVADDIVYDYGDYAIRATLQQLEIKPRDGC